eukprot:6796156-Prymnesium_polylepis.2
MHTNLAKCRCGPQPHVATELRGEGSAVEHLATDTEAESNTHQPSVSEGRCGCALPLGLGPCPCAVARGRSGGPPSRASLSSSDARRNILLLRARSQPQNPQSRYAPRSSESPTRLSGVLHEWSVECASVDETRERQVRVAPQRPSGPAGVPHLTPLSRAAGPHAHLAECACPRPSRAAQPTRGRPAAAAPTGCATAVRIR